MLGLNVFYHLILLALLKRVWFNHTVSILAFPGLSQFHIFYCCISKHVFVRPYIPIWDAKILVSIFNCKSSVNWNVYWTRNSTPGLWDCASNYKYLIYALKEVFLLSPVCHFTCGLTKQSERIPKSECGPNLLQHKWVITEISLLSFSLFY